MTKLDSKLDLHFELRALDGKSFPIRGDVVRVGRSSDNTVVLNDPAVSRYHLNFFMKDGSLIAEDAGSQNGFLVNGESIKGNATLLRTGDRIVIGSREYTVTGPGGQVPAAPASFASTFGSAPASSSASSLAGPSSTLNLGGPVSAGPANGSRTRTVAIAAVAALVLGGAYKMKEEESARAPASSDAANAAKDAGATAPLNPEGYKAAPFRQRSISEVRAESKFRETLRDYDNGNYSRALLGFRESLQLNPAHAGAAEYLQLADNRLTTQLDELLKEGQRSAANLQFHRARANAMEVLSILSEQVPGYGRRIAQETMSAAGPQTTTQEENLLKIPCDKTKQQKACQSAADLLTRCRQALGEEDALKNGY